MVEVDSKVSGGYEEIVAKQRRGLACLPTEKVREIARLGGRAVQRSGRGHRWTRAEAAAQRQAQLEKKREEEEFTLRLRAKLRAKLGRSPGSAAHTVPDDEGREG